MNKGSKIFVAGGYGMVGSSIIRRLESEGYTNVITRTHFQLDLTDQSKVEAFFKVSQPEYVFMAAARVGGILANNTYRGQFIYENIMMQTNVIHCAYKYGVKKLLFLASNCLYPKNALNPIKEEYLLTGELEPTNEPYAIAKISGIKMCEAYRSQYECNFISCLPCNLYGQGDHYDLEKCHVMPALIRKFHEAKVNNTAVTIWGDGISVRREFLYVDDCAEACVFLMNNYNEASPINIGSGYDFTIKEIAEVVKGIIEFNGEIIYDTSKLTGTNNKLLDITKINRLGWVHKVFLAEGILRTYNHILENKIYEQWH